MNKYHEKFLNSFSSENVIALFSRYKKASKEITESWAMLEAAWKYVPKLDEWEIVVVGDGAAPRTASLFAYFTKSPLVTSVDPKFNMDHWEEHIKKQTGMGMPPQRMLVAKEKIENYPIYCGHDTVVIWPHSHADMNRCQLIGNFKRIDIAMPCCVPVPREWMERPHITYDDYNVISPKRTIHVWLPLEKK